MIMEKEIKKILKDQKDFTGIAISFEM